MVERTSKTIRKSLYFEKNGETLSIEVILDNISPQVKPDAISAF